MSKQTSALLLASAASLALVAAPSSASTCSISACMVPALLPASGDVPSDFLRFTFRKSSIRSLLDDDRFAPTYQGPPPRMYRLDATGKPELALVDVTMGSSRTYAIRDPIAPGTRLLAEADAAPCRPGESLRTEYLVTEPRPTPAVLGTLEAS